MIRELCPPETTYQSVRSEDSHIQVATSILGDSPDWLVFIHGLGCARQGFDGVFDRPDLRERYTLMTIDLPGFGESVKPADFSYELEEQANTVTQLLGNLAAQRVNIVGHSMGGVVGLLVAHQVKAQLFINCEGNFVASDAGLASRHIANQPEADFQARGFKEFVSQLKKSEDNADKTWAKWCQQSTPLAFHRSAQSLVKWSDSKQILGLYQSLESTAYIHGAHGLVSEVTPQLPNVFTIPGSGHFMMLDNPNGLYDTIAKI